MSNQGAEAFGTFLANFIAHSGKFADPTALAREAGISPSAISRYINAKERPSLGTLERLAPHVGASVSDLVAVAYPENVGEGVVVTIAEVDPLAAELAAMLAEDSPLSDEDRRDVRRLVDRVIDPHRRAMKRRRSA